ncbi:TetR/AcrR family transcriptional regulator [Nonomuraea rubra]|uniref:TetR/AcrR family transcriptional regulator n=1 Tax=Nonomuraea rubra TaxID=46180 RepID=UPI0036115FC4
MVVTAYQQAQREGQSVVRAAILDAAKRLLVTEGPAALTVRRISGEVGCSTKVIYTLFGGKDGLGEALWLEGFARFEQVLLSVPARDDPFERLHLGLMAYREYALSEPDYYRVMFQGALPGLNPSPEAVQAAKRTFGLLVRGWRTAWTPGCCAGPRQWRSPTCCGWPCTAPWGWRSRDSSIGRWPGGGSGSSASRCSRRSWLATMKGTRHDHSLQGWIRPGERGDHRVRPRRHRPHPGRAQRPLPA